MHDDGEAMAITTQDAQSAQRFARKLLHRLSQTLAFGLLCEAATAAETRERQAHSAWRYFEQIEPQGFGSEDVAARRVVLDSLQDEAEVLR